MNEINETIDKLEKRLKDLENEKSSILNEISSLRSKLIEHKQNTNEFSSKEKINIFMNLFRGRTDVFPKRWDNIKTNKSGYSPACSNEWIRGVCNKPKIKCGDCNNQLFIPLTANIVHKHLVGENNMYGKKDHTIGICPMLPDNKCWFLAVDFDKENWQLDAKAFLSTCNDKNVPAYLERSRSGNGGHVWIFFKESILATNARKLGSYLMTETMKQNPEIGFESYDRFFPNQDTLPSGGFGNLIALPLQLIPREKGNSIFLDNEFKSYPDQWLFLSSVIKVSDDEVNRIIDKASFKNEILDIHMPVCDDNDEKPWENNSNNKVLEIQKNQKLPQLLTIVISNQLFIDKRELPPILVNRLVRLAAFQNPEFYKAQALRLSIFGKPRIICCAEILTNHIALPRGCLDSCIELLKSLDIKIHIDDKRNFGINISPIFLGQLTEEQQKAACELLKYDTGILSATTGFGKTVIGAFVTAARKTNTLIIVHRKQLMEQWVERLKTFLDADQIGIIGGGKRKPTGIIDIAIIQSLIKDHIVDNIVTKYGHIIVDECHHLSAVSFESVIKTSKAKYILGLSATITRKDGHHPIIFMQCGPVRYNVDAKIQARLRSFDHKVIIRNTSFVLPLAADKKIPISEVYSSLVNNEERNELIFNDVLTAIHNGKTPLILTERKEHVLYFFEKFNKFCKNVIVMYGGQSIKQRAEIKNKLDSISDHEERLIIATGRYIGEGFDDPRLDTLFLTTPVSWHGTVTQYTGRLHRTHHSKKEVVVYDYVDSNVRSLVRMSERRINGYKKIGYIIT